MGRKAPLNVTIQIGYGRDTYKVEAASRDGPLPYATMVAFSKALGIVPQDPVSLKEDERKKDPMTLGTYPLSGFPVQAQYSGSSRTFSLQGLPPQMLSKVCVQPNLVAELTLGRYHDSTGRFKIRRNAEQAGIKVTD